MPRLDRLGLPGIVGAGLILFCAAFYFGSVRPATQSLAELRSAESRLLAEAAVARSAAADGGTVAARALPPVTEIPELLKAIDALAEKHGLTADRAAYVLSDQNGQRRIEVKLPLKGAYPPLRAYLREVQTLAASASLDELSLQRRDAAEPLVEATVRFSFHFAPVA